MEVTTSEQLAKLLDNFNSEDKLTRYIVKQAKDNNLIIVSAIGDDTITFSGALTDEFELFRGGEIFMAKEIDSYIPYLKQGKCGKRKKIEAFWEEHRLFTWKFLTLIPHTTFAIKRANKNYCRGIVFSLNDI